MVQTNKDPTNFFLPSTATATHVQFSVSFGHDNAVVVRAGPCFRGFRGITAHFNHVDIPTFVTNLPNFFNDHVDFFHFDGVVTLQSTVQRTVVPVHEETVENTVENTIERSRKKTMNIRSNWSCKCNINNKTPAQKMLLLCSC